MRTARLLILLCCALILSGCYATSIDTGRPRSSTVIRKGFASCWIYGLVPPKTVETAAQCPNGVALVQTRLSFLNMLVGNLTLGIYTPVEIVVTCAEGAHSGVVGSESEIHLAKNATPEEVSNAFQRAADEAVRTKQVVAVYMDR